jgi:hypothetical protein
VTRETAQKPEGYDRGGTNKQLLFRCRESQTHRPVEGGHCPSITGLYRRAIPTGPALNPRLFRRRFAFNTAIAAGRSDGSGRDPTGIARPTAGCDPAGGTAARPDRPGRERAMRADKELADPVETVRGTTG